jgi:hypothetical protein
MLKELLVALVQSGGVKVDLDELGQMAGLTLEEVKQTLAPDEPAEPSEPATEPDPASPPGGDDTEARSTGKEIVARVRAQAQKAFDSDSFGPDLQINMGYRRKFERALEANGVEHPITAAADMYNKMDNWLADVTRLGKEGFKDVDTFMGSFTKVLDHEISEVTR